MTTYRIQRTTREGVKITEIYVRPTEYTSIEDAETGLVLDLANATERPHVREVNYRTYTTRPGRTHELNVIRWGSE